MPALYICIGLYIGFLIGYGVRPRSVAKDEPEHERADWWKRGGQPPEWE